jgi:uncharacterized RDD family membrane protein YckC
VARILDSIIESLIAAPFVLLLIGPAFQRLLDATPAGGSVPSQTALDAFSSDVLANAGMITAVTVVVSLLYQVPQNVRWGRTLGKRALGIRIRPLAADVPLTWLQAGIRWATYAAFSLALGGVLLVLDLLWPLWDRPWQQALHDKTARTVVVPTRQPDRMPPVG